LVENPLRQGRVIPWFVEALAPIERSIGEEGVHQLALAPRAVGIETRVWLSYAAGLPPLEVSALQHWMVDALVKWALEHRHPTGIGTDPGMSGRT